MLFGMLTEWYLENGLPLNPAVILADGIICSIVGVAQLI